MTIALINEYFRLRRGIVMQGSIENCFTAIRRSTDEEAMEAVRLNEVGLGTDHVSEYNDDGHDDDTLLDAWEGDPSEGLMKNYLTSLGEMASRSGLI